MLSALFRRVAIAEWLQDHNMHVATLAQVDENSPLSDSDFGVFKESGDVKIFVPPDKLVVGRTYRIAIEDAPEQKAKDDS
jgi:hypothetical protein